MLNEHIRCLQYITTYIIACTIDLCTYVQELGQVSTLSHDRVRTLARQHIRLTNDGTWLVLPAKTKNTNNKCQVSIK